MNLYCGSGIMVSTQGALLVLCIAKADNESKIAQTYAVVLLA